MNTGILDPIPAGFGETYRRVLPYGRHARVFWKPNQRTVAEIRAANPDLVLDEHFATVPRDTDLPSLAGEG